MIRSLTLGADGPSLPALGLGCMGMSEFYGATDDQESLHVLRRASELGIRMLDTADMYGSGHNEQLVGRFIADVGREMFVATKFGIRRNPDGGGRRIDNSPEYIRAACEGSLRRLGREAIDLYYVHRVEPARPIEDVVGALADLVGEGKVRAIGLSEVSAATLRRAHAVHPIAAVQSEYSLTTRDVEADVLPACMELGVAFVAYSPLGRGLLSGELDGAMLAEGDFRRTAPRFADGALAKNAGRLVLLKDMARRLGATPAQISLAWVLAKGVFAIPGTKRLGYLEQNVASAALELAATDIAALDAAYPPGAFTGARYAEAGRVGLNA